MVSPITRLMFWCVRRYAELYLDQHVLFEVQTKHGPVYLNISREEPGSSLHVGPESYH